MTLPIGRTNEEDLVSSEQVARVDLVGHVIETGVVAVGDDGLALALEGFEVAHNATAEEGGAVGKGGLVDDDFGRHRLRRPEHSHIALSPSSSHRRRCSG